MDRLRSVLLCSGPSGSMSKNRGFAEVIEISSSDDELEGSEDKGNKEEQDEEAGMKREGKERERKGEGDDVSPSSVLVKTVEDKKAEDDDCYILDFNPFDSVAADLASKLSLACADQEEDLSVLAEKGEVACRDFPHSRHTCAQFIFDKTPHESYCAQCYCYVCDSPAPCTRWKGSLHSHCHASDQQSMWKDLRSHEKNEVKSNK